MPKAWEKLDLHGEGLQNLQIRLQKAQKNRRTAYLSWLAFVVGAHRFYLQQPLAWAYPLASLLVLILALTLPWYAPLALGLLLLLAALWDLRHLEDWLSHYNRQQRMAQWFAKQSPPAPKGFQGRPENLNAEEQWQEELQNYRTVKESERAGHQRANNLPQKGFGPGQRRLSFAEQERLLAEIHKKKSKEEE